MPNRKKGFVWNRPQQTELQQTEPPAPADLPKPRLTRTWPDDYTDEERQALAGLMTRHRATHAGLPQDAPRDQPPADA